MTDDELDAAIKRLCEAKGMVFRPWEDKPWLAWDEENPHPHGSEGWNSWPRAREIRRALVAEIEADRAEPGTLGNRRPKYADHPPKARHHAEAPSHKRYCDRLNEGARKAGAISRCKSGPGKAVAGRLEASVA